MGIHEKNEQICWKVVLAEWRGFCRAAMISLPNWISLKCQERKTVTEVKWKRGEYQTSAVRRDHPAVCCVPKYWQGPHIHTLTHLACVYITSYINLFLFSSKAENQRKPDKICNCSAHIQPYIWILTCIYKSISVIYDSPDCRLLWLETGLMAQEPGRLSASNRSVCCFRQHEPWPFDD